jgi:hypothetical protein
MRLGPPVPTEIRVDKWNLLERMAEDAMCGQVVFSTAFYIRQHEEKRKRCLLRAHAQAKKLESDGNDSDDYSLPDYDLYPPSTQESDPQQHIEHQSLLTMEMTEFKNKNAAELLALEMTKHKNKSVAQLRNMLKEEFNVERADLTSRDDLVALYCNTVLDQREREAKAKAEARNWKKLVRLIDKELTPLQLRRKLRELDIETELIHGKEALVQVYARALQLGKHKAVTPLGSIRLKSPTLSRR